ncbi:glycosyltransferase [Haloarchaeobius sp. DFWS5]|uniref:glycosyltransferase n=1 Tax=Haloarchaeobius sp. DFWS5 TaxID=3446114 RepID=UPI003EB9BED5
MSRSVGIVVPAYDPNVDTLVDFLHALTDRLDPAELVVELDAPTSAVVAALRDAPGRVYPADSRRGKGAAITCGFERLDTDVLAFADADGATPAHSIADVVEPVQKNHVGLSVGSRRHPEADVRSHQTFARRYLGDGFAWLARQALGVDFYDFQCGAKAIDAEVWNHVRDHLYEPGFAWDIELVAITTALGFSATEVPVTWEDQPESTVSPIGTTIELAVSLAKSRHRAQRLRGNPVHTFISARRQNRLALVERHTVDTDD